MFDESAPAPANLLGVADAARRLGVSEQQVRQLVRDHKIEATRVGHAFLIRPAALAEFERSERAPKGRAFTPANAWAILFMAAGEPVSWSSASEQWRFRNYLAHASLADLAPRLRGRANVRRLYAHPSAIARLRRDERIMLSGVSAADALDLDLIGGEDEVDLYAPPEVAEDLIGRYVMMPSESPNVVLRVLPRGMPPSLPQVAPWPVVGLDLIEHRDPRARQVGHQLMAAAA